MKNIVYKTIGLCGVVAMMSGCMMKQQAPIVYANKIMFGAGVNGGTGDQGININVGYKYDEFLYIPTAVTDHNGTDFNQTDDDILKIESYQMKKDENKTDALSVYANFGIDNGNGADRNSTASIKLNTHKVVATGIAAQNVSSRELAQLNTCLSLASALNSTNLSPDLNETRDLNISNSVKQEAMKSILANCIK